MPLSLQVSISEATMAQFSAPSIRDPKRIASMHARFGLDYVG
jgi:hypothetical protein